MENCQLALKVTYHPLYRFGQFYTFLVSVFASISLSIFFRTTLARVHFHGNLKVLLYGYFGMILFDSIVVSLTFGYHSFQPFFAVSSCDLILNQFLFKLFQPIFTMGLIGPMFFPISISIERLVALKLTSQYENLPVCLGPILTILAILLTISTTIYTFFDEKFDDPFISFILTSASSASKINYLFMSFLGLLFASFITIFLVLWKSFKLKAKSQSTESLAFRYGIRELIVSTKFSSVIILVHLLFVFWYLILILSIRLYGNKIFENTVQVTAAKGVFLGIPTFNLTIPFIAKICLKQLSSNQLARIENVVGMKTTGQEGVNNYDNIINDLWNRNRNSIKI